MDSIKIHPWISELQDQLVEHRRWFHAHPELSLEEFNTSKRIEDIISSIDGIEEIRTGIAKTGVTALIRGGAGEGPTIALRADMDALPILESNDLAFKSQNEGVMHACGHDGHISILLAVARALASHRGALRGQVKLLFQPAEESQGGAARMIEEGVLESPHVDEVYGLHLWNYVPYGRVCVRRGALMASSDLFEIEVSGHGGHGAVPQGTVDAVACAGHLVTALQTVVSRNVPPLEPSVLTIGTIRGGFAPNVIADKVELAGTVRTLSPAVQKTIVERMEGICNGVGKTFGADIRLKYMKQYPTTRNTDKDAYELVSEAARSVVGGDNVMDPEPTMAAEDFSFFLEKRPGNFFFVGSAPDGPVRPHHKSVFDIDERSLSVGASVMLQCVLLRLSK